MAIAIQTQAQNVGIGNPAPTEKLDVTGNINVTGTIKANGIDGTAGQVLQNNGNGTISWASGTNLGNYSTVVNPVTGKIWLDRNLGATQVATSATDISSYGDLYQWGRSADGHQKRSSGIVSVLASNYFTTFGSFIINNTSPYNWLSSEETHMWKGLGAENNPCPSGFRIPTAAEWNQERLTWISNNPAGAMASPLKLPLAGYRSYINGVLDNLGTYGHYWSSTVNNSEARSLVIGFFSSLDTSTRANGLCVRCIKD